MKLLAIVFTVMSLSSFAYADGMSDLWSGLAPAAARAAAEAQAAQGAAWSRTQYPACDSNGGPNQCADGYICWGSNQCLPQYCHMGCAYNSPCWPDGTCNYGE